MIKQLKPIEFILRMWKTAMNKGKSGNWRTLNILLIFICGLLAFVIYVLYSFIQYDMVFHRKVEYLDKNEEYKIILEQIYEDSLVPYYIKGPRITVGKKTDEKWIYKKLFKVPISTVDTLTLGNYSVDWIDGGVIIKIIKVKHEENRTYRVYWEDVF